MAPLDQSFIKAYTSESTIDTLQPIESRQQQPAGPVPAPHARFRPVQPKSLASRPVANNAKKDRSQSGFSKIDRSALYAAWTTSISSDSVVSDTIDSETLGNDTLGNDTIGSDRASITPPKVSPQSERQIAIDDDVELPPDDDGCFQHDAEQPVSIPMPSRNAHIALRPELEVDRFAWARQIETLERHGKIRDLIDTLTETSATGDNVLVLAGQQSGSGVSTLVLAAARALSNMGLRVAIVDANFQRPALAQMLGIAPPAGWEDVLGRRSPLAEVLVESLEDGLVLLPLADKVDGQLLCQTQTVLRETVRAMSLDFDVVLIDGGASVNGGDDPTGNDLLTSDEIDILRLAGDEIDAVVCVRDVRIEPTAAAVTRPRRKSSSIRQLGVVENFTL